EAPHRTPRDEGKPGADAHRLLGRVLCRLGRHAEARPALEEALRLDPKHVGAELDLGVVRLETGEKEAARACFDRVIARAPENPRAYNNRAIAYVALQKFD